MSGGHYQEGAADELAAMPRRPKGGGDEARRLAASALERGHPGNRRHALELLARALACSPDDAAGHYLRGQLFHADLKPHAALDSYDKGLALKPDHADAHVKRGNALRSLDRPDAALDAYERAIAAQPDHMGARANRASTLAHLGRSIESVAGNEDILRRDPTNAMAHSNLLVTIPFMSEYGPADVAREHRRFGEMHARRFIESWQPHANPPDPDRRLKIGYLSPQLRAHVLASAMLPLLAGHRRDHVSVHVFAHVPVPDAITAHMRKLSDEWTDIHDLGDGEAAARVRASGIDILVHPMGHWASNRLLVLARKPAPIQVNYLCNSPTTGMKAVDYTIVDRWLDHDGRLADLVTEVPWHLPSGFHFQICEAEPPIHPPPVLSTGRITFGSFNNPSKISSACLDLWARVLTAVPSARLLIKGYGLDRPSVSAALIGRLAAVGIEPTRIEIRGRVPSLNQHLENYRDIDIVLDTTPFTGGRTTFDALWMGVPVVTLVGEAVYGRFSYSYLMRAGLPELCAFTAEEFAHVAAELARTPDRLIAYRRMLRDAVKRSAIMNSSRHVTELEEAYRAMWHRWCAAQRT